MLQKGNSRLRRAFLRLWRRFGWPVLAAAKGRAAAAKVTDITKWSKCRRFPGAPAANLTFGVFAAAQPPGNGIPGRAGIGYDHAHRMVGRHTEHAQCVVSGEIAFFDIPERVHELQATAPVRTPDRGQADHIGNAAVLSGYSIIVPCQKMPWIEARCLGVCEADRVVVGHNACEFEKFAAVQKFEDLVEVMARQLFLVIDVVDRNGGIPILESVRRLAINQLPEFIALVSRPPGDRICIGIYVISAVHVDHVPALLRSQRLAYCVCGSEAQKVSNLDASMLLELALQRFHVMS
jgi:hypothetical protein